MTATKKTKTAKDGAAATYNLAQATESGTGNDASLTYIADPTTEAIISPMPSTGGSVTSLSGPAITNPISTLQPLAVTAAYAVGDLIASHAAAASIIVPFFNIATAGGGAILSSIRLWTSGVTGWDGAILLARLWKAAPTYTAGDNGPYGVATGSAGWLGEFLFTLHQFGDGAIGRAQLTDANSMAFRLAAGTAVFWDLQINSVATRVTNQTFILTPEPLN